MLQDKLKKSVACITGPLLYIEAFTLLSVTMFKPKYVRKGWTFPQETIKTKKQFP